MTRILFLVGILLIWISTSGCGGESKQPEPKKIEGSLRSRHMPNGDTVPSQGKRPPRMVKPR
jgi:hypothetical protein